MSTTHVALLRGINVGGKNKLPMKELAAMFEDAGCSDVRTFIQSGNVLFNADAGILPGLAGTIAEQIAGSFGHKPPVILRTAKQLAQVIAKNPFLKKGAAEETLHVLFLADLPTQSLIDGLDPMRSPPDAFVVQGQEIYLMLPNGVADSKLTNSYFDSKLATICTGRNWRTVNKLHELMRGK
jgi:uncharacterized protein (DUF1697 family)